MESTFSNVGKNNGRHIESITVKGAHGYKGSDKIEFLLESLICAINDKEFKADMPDIELKPNINVSVPQIDIPDIVLPEMDPPPTYINMKPNPWWVYAIIVSIPTLAIIADVVLRLIELRMIGL